MTLSDLASLGSFVSGVAVVISLISLTIQMRQSTLVTMRAESNASQEQVSQWRLTIANSAELASIWLRGQRDEDLTEIEEMRYSFLLFDLALAIVQTWDRINKGMVAAETWQRTAPILAGILVTRRGSAWWKRSRLRFPADYAAAVDAAIRDHQTNGGLVTADPPGAFANSEAVKEGTR
jgi:hypothetical protein